MGLRQFRNYLGCSDENDSNFYEQIEKTGHQTLHRKPYTSTLEAPKILKPLLIPVGERFSGFGLGVSLLVLFLVKDEPSGAVLPAASSFGFGRKVSVRQTCEFKVFFEGLGFRV